METCIFNWRNWRILNFRPQIHLWSQSIWIIFKSSTTKTPTIENCLEDWTSKTYPSKRRAKSSLENNIDEKEWHPKWTPRQKIRNHQHINKTKCTCVRKQKWWRWFGLWRCETLKETRELFIKRFRRWIIG